MQTARFHEPIRPEARIASSVRLATPTFSKIEWR
jgi:hypothetical protein